jgi:hypothetical protein
MQRAPQFLANDETFDKRTSVVCTACTDCKKIIAAARKQNIFAIGLTLKHPKVW